MKNLVNITTSAEQPTFVDARCITGIHILPDKDTMTIYTEKGVLFSLEMKSWKVDADDLLKKLADAGNALVSMPMRHDAKEYPHFIAPEAVTFATVTQVAKDGTQGIIIGVKGLGWEENYEAKPSEIAMLLDAVRQSGKQLMEFTPSEAHARWSTPAALYIDPASVSEIRDDGGQLNVSFIASGTLDVQTEDYTFGNRRSPAEEHTARADLAAKIANANGELTQISGANRAVYVQPQAFATIRFHTVEGNNANKYSMTLERQKTAENPYRESVRISFNTAAQRETAFQHLLAAAQTPATKKTKGPQP